VQASVPANLLLLGEYAVLEEGGLGLAAAVEPRARVRAEPGRASLRVIGRMGPGAELLWSPGYGRDDPRAAFLESVVRECCPAGQPSGTVEVDTSALFPGGRKAGYGSSAAAAVALCWGLLALAAGTPPPPAAVLKVALAAHRRAQGGRGSGYDVLTSLHGGIGLFTGGAQPAWESLALPWLEPLFLFRGGGSVSTPDAIQRYRAWAARRPEEAQRFLQESNCDVQAFAQAGSRREAGHWFLRCRQRGLRLGEDIGVGAAVLPPFPGLPVEHCKALGAGNELGMVFSDLSVEASAGELQRIVLAGQGLVQEGAV
jgi:phosphomevalonate kinase